MSIEFLGNKINLLDFIVPIIESKTVGEERSITDLFCGTGVISEAFSRRGYEVSANDQLTFCAHFARARLLNNDPQLFSTLRVHLEMQDQEKAYVKLIETLNQLTPLSGFIHKQYSPASLSISPYERMYFTEDNALKIDAIRIKLEEWKPFLRPAEFSLLITDLIIASNKVSNTAGTFGCYLKKWKKKALMPLRLVPSKLSLGHARGDVSNMDAAKMATKQIRPIVYADPPYTKRQYAAYYHLLETIALYDNPKISGSTGLRDWMDKQSDYCYKRKAPGVLKKLLEDLSCRHFFMSYNEDGQISHQQILSIMSNFGEVSFDEIQYKRYKSSALQHKGQYLKERLYHLRTV